MGRRRIELAGIRLLQSHNIAREFNASCLHTQANSEVWNLLLPSIANRNQHAFNAALAEPARNQKTVVTLELRFKTIVACLESLSLNPIQLQLKIVR